MTIYEILEDYTKWLLEHNYCDDDVWCEEPKAVERFLEDRDYKAHKKINEK